jgi:hypothetical protein
MHSGYAKLQDECESLCNVAKTLKQEKTEAETAHEAEVTIHKNLKTTVRTVTKSFAIIGLAWRRQWVSLVLGAFLTPVRTAPSAI